MRRIPPSGLRRGSDARRIRARRVAARWPGRHPAGQLPRQEGVAVKLDPATLRDLVDERLPRGQVRAIQSGFKDADRFDKYVALLQERVPWDDRIVLPFGEHLYIVRKAGPSPN